MCKEQCPVITLLQFSCTCRRCSTARVNHAERFLVREVTNVNVGCYRHCPQQSTKRQRRITIRLQTILQTWWCFSLYFRLITDVTNTSLFLGSSHQVGSTALLIIIIINTTVCFQTLFSFANHQNKFFIPISRGPIALGAPTKMRHAVFILGIHRG